jgi:hypothetical protein
MYMKDDGGRRQRDYDGARSKVLEARDKYIRDMQSAWKRPARDAAPDPGEPDVNRRPDTDRMRRHLEPDEAARLPVGQRQGVLRSERFEKSR